MSLELRIPPVGESITEVQIGEWKKQEGQSVRKDEILVLIESEKATIELPAPSDGVLTHILKQRGSIVRIGEVIAEVGASIPSSQPNPPDPGVPTGAPTSSELPKPSDGPVVLPAARRILAEAGIPPARVTGTGPGGRITKEDALRAGVVPPVPTDSVQSEKAAISTQSTGSGLPQPSSPPPSIVSAAASVPPAGPIGVGREDEVVPMSPLRRTVARRLVEAQGSMAMLTTFNEVDMSAITSLRKQYQDAFVARHGVKLGFMSFFVKAVIEGLKQFPQLNAEIRDSNIVYHHYYDIGVAIGGGKGLVVPVLRNAERLSFAEVEKSIGDFGARAKDGRIKPDELAGGTFTITNGGVYGSLLSTPIINPPQSGILGMHSIQDRPVAVDGQVVIRPMMYIALTYDHRVVDGREAVTFLKRIKEVVEAPARMLLEA